MSTDKERRTSGLGRDHLPCLLLPYPQSPCLVLTRMHDLACHTQNVLEKPSIMCGFLLSEGFDFVDNRDSRCAL